MVGILRKGIEVVGIQIEYEGEMYPLHESSYGKHLHNKKDRSEVEFVFANEGCPYGYTSRCTQGRCECGKTLYAKLN